MSDTTQDTAADAGQHPGQPPELTPELLRSLHDGRLPDQSQGDAPMMPDEPAADEPASDPDPLRERVAVLAGRVRELDGETDGIRDLVQRNTQQLTEILSGLQRRFSSSSRRSSSPRDRKGPMAAMARMARQARRDLGGCEGREAMPVRRAHAGRVVPRGQPARRDRPAAMLPFRRTGFRLAPRSLVFSAQRADTTPTTSPFGPLTAANIVPNGCTRSFSIGICSRKPEDGSIMASGAVFMPRVVVSRMTKVFSEPSFGSPDAEGVLTRS